MQKLGSNNWPLILFIGGIVLVLYTTLFPFDFVFETTQRLPLWTLPQTDSYDLVGNILLYIPLGLGFSGLLPRRRSAAKGRILATVVLGIILAAGIEFLQVYLLARNSSLLDILTNSIGAFSGAMLFLLLQRVPCSYKRFFHGRGFAMLSRVSLALFLGGISLFTVLISILNSDSSLRNWDETYPLVLGNEQEGGRAWHGYIQELHFANKAIPENEIADLLSPTSASAMFDEHLIASYRLTAPNRLHDSTGHLPALVWRPTPIFSAADDKVSTNTMQWLETEAPVSFLNRALATGSEFTLWAVFATADIDQTGPARIISISKNSVQRNLTLGQQGQDLVLRLRTVATGENGIYPELRIANVFADLDFHQVIMTYDGTTVNAYVDAVDRPYTFNITPSITFFQFLLPVEYWTMRMNSFGIWVFKILYYGLIGLPLGVYLLSLTPYSRSAS